VPAPLRRSRLQCLRNSWRLALASRTRGWAPTGIQRALIGGMRSLRRQRMPHAFERGDAFGFALVGDVDVDLGGADVDVPASARMIPARRRVRRASCRTCAAARGRCPTGDTTCTGTRDASIGAQAGDNAGQAAWPAEGQRYPRTRGACAGQGEPGHHDPRRSPRGWASSRTTCTACCPDSPTMASSSRRAAAGSARHHPADTRGPAPLRSIQAPLGQSSRMMLDSDDAARGCAVLRGQ
jgi:hypothetical protein